MFLQFLQALKDAQEFEVCGQAAVRLAQAAPRPEPGNPSRISLAHHAVTHGAFTMTSNAIEAVYIVDSNK